MIKSRRNNAWTSSEIQLISELHPQFTSKRWKRIAEEFKARGYDRTEIECREKWINFLDPQINRRDWSDEELGTLYRLHGQVGTRWCLVQKAISRTQNQIKNRFYGTLRNFVRFTLSHFDTQQSCFNVEISHLSPSFLNALYSSSAEFAFMQQEAKDAIEAMRFRVDKQLLLARIAAKRNIYERLNTVVLQHFAEGKERKDKERKEVGQGNSQTSGESASNNFPFQHSGVSQWGSIYPFLHYQNGSLYWGQ